MEISVKHLKALLLFAGRNDIRYYLNGIAIQGRFAVATDGPRAVRRAIVRAAAEIGRAMP